MIILNTKLIIHHCCSHNLWIYYEDSDNNNDKNGKQRKYIEDMQGGGPNLIESVSRVE